MSQPNLTVLTGSKQPTAVVELPRFLPAAKAPDLYDARAIIGNVYEDLEDLADAVRGGFVDVTALLSKLEALQSLVGIAGALVQEAL